MLKKILLIFNLMLALSFTSCEGESSDEKEKSLSLTLNFLGITDPVIVKSICQDRNKDGRCGQKELLSKMNLKKNESVDETLQKIILMENGKYFLENITPNAPLLVEIYDPQKIKYDDGSLILRFNGFKIEEKNSVKEISAIQLLEDWEFLFAQETKKFKETENRELLDHVIFESLENNYNLLRDESLSTKVATDKGLEVLANRLKKIDIAEKLPNKIVFCTDSDTCMQNLVISTFQALTITKKEAEVIAQNTYNSNSITVMPTLTPFPTAISTLTPVSTTVVPTLTPVQTTVVPTSTAVPTVVPTSTAVPTVVPTSTAVPTVVPTSTAVPTIVPTSIVVPTVVPRLKEMQKVKSTLKKTGQTTIYQKFDDGDYQTGVNPNYSRVGDIVTDNITGLQWQDDKDAKIVHKTWITAENYKKKNYNDSSGDTAITYCDKLTLGGYGNWRLPTRKELLGIINYGKFNPSVDSVFVNVSSKKYWSSTKIADDSGDISSRWVVSFLNGAMLDSDGKTNSDNNNSYYIRCIRGED